MNEARQRRVQQLETLRQTVSGRERIFDAYRRACTRAGQQDPTRLPMPDVIDAILQAEFAGESAVEPKTSTQA